MKDHLHVIWNVPLNGNIRRIIKMFKTYTGQKILSLIRDCNPEYLSNFMSGRKDRDYKFWKYRGGNILIESQKMFDQKLNYSHLNPTKGDYKVVDNPEDYLYSSAQAYLLEESNFTFLTLCM